MHRLVARLLVICVALALVAPASAAPIPAKRPAPFTPAPRAARAVPGEYLMKFKPGTPRDVQLAAVNAHGGRFFDRVDDLDIQAVVFPALVANPRADAAAAIVGALSRNPNVEFIEPNGIVSVAFTPNDPGRTAQYAWNIIDAYDAWSITRGKASTVIAVVDTGIQRSHPDLDAKIVAGYDYVENDSAPDDSNGHGTHVAGTAAAETNNGIGGAGTCPNCKLMPVRVLDENGNGTTLNVIKGIDFAANQGAKVINLSLGGVGFSALKTAIDAAWNKGAFLACASGNDNTSSTTLAYPGAYPNCFAVDSTDDDDYRSSFSNWGRWTEAAAPGSAIYSTWIGSSYNTIDGTSMATPHVAGLAGLLSGQGLSNAQIKTRLCKTADQISGTGNLWMCGRINAYRALRNDQNASIPVRAEIVNGGFENGNPPWKESSPAGYQLLTHETSYTGAYSAFLCGYDSATESLYQTFKVPAGGVLRFTWAMNTDETSATTASDVFRVRLYNTSGGLVATLRTRSNLSPEGVWTLDTINLNSYAGRTLRLQFSCTTNSSASTAFYVDAVRVD